MGGLEKQQHQQQRWGGNIGPVLPLTPNSLGDAGTAIAAATPAEGNNGGTADAPVCRRSSRRFWNPRSCRRRVPATAWFGVDGPVLVSTCSTSSATNSAPFDEVDRRDAALNGCTRADVCVVLVHDRLRPTDCHADSPLQVYGCFEKVDWCPSRGREASAMVDVGLPPSSRLCRLATGAVSEPAAMFMLQ